LLIGAAVLLLINFLLASFLLCLNRYERQPQSVVQSPLDPQASRR